MLIAFAETSSPMRSQLNDPFKHLQFSMHDILLFPTISDLIGQLEHVASPLCKGCILYCTYYMFTTLCLLPSRPHHVFVVLTWNTIDLHIPHPILNMKLMMALLC